MALPDLDAVKLRLRIENDEEDDDLELMMASAQAFIEEFCGRPITATEREFVIEAPSSFDCGVPCTSFFLPLYPVDPETVEITESCLHENIGAVRTMTLR